MFSLKPAEQFQLNLTGVSQLRSIRFIKIGSQKAFESDPHKYPKKMTATQTIHYQIPEESRQEGRDRGGWN